MVIYTGFMVTYSWFMGIYGDLEWFMVINHGIVAIYGYL